MRPQRGGKHVAMGTHNSLLRLGDSIYLEVIAIDPEGAAPQHPRWFDLDTSAMRDALRIAPRLIHWVARTDDIDAAVRACAVDCGVVTPMVRGAYQWSMTIPEDGHLPGRGLLPTLIQWRSPVHPAAMLPDAGVRIVALAGAHPEPDSIRRALKALGANSILPLSFGKAPRFIAMLRGPRGSVTLSS